MGLQKLMILCDDCDLNVTECQMMQGRLTTKAVIVGIKVGSPKRLSNYLSSSRERWVKVNVVGSNPSSVAY